MMFPTILGKTLMEAVVLIVACMLQGMIFKFKGKSRHKIVIQGNEDISDIARLAYML